MGRAGRGGDYSVRPGPSRYPQPPTPTGARPGPPHEAPCPPPSAPHPGSREHLVSSDVDLGSLGTVQEGLCARATMVCTGAKDTGTCTRVCTWHTRLVSLGAGGFCDF